MAGQGDPRGGKPSPPIGTAEPDGGLSATVTTLSDAVASPFSPGEGAVRRSGSLPRGTPVGRYVVLDPIGEGGMGVVYRALDPELDRSIALKLVRVRSRDPAQRERQKTRLVREAQAMARLAHPNVVSVHDVGTFEDDVFVAMELVDGRTLSQFLRDEKPSPGEVIELFVGAGRGLAAAHAAGLVHRDFKPDNLAVGSDRRARVLDFGLARAVAQGGGADDDIGELWGSPRLLDAALTRDGAVIGTPSYMAPEQLRGESVDERADQFSFCVALYQALYGSLPFGERRAISGALPPLVLPASPRVAAPVGHALVRGLAADPAARYPSMDALLADLGGSPSSAPVRNPRRRRALAIGLAVALGAGAVVAGSAWRAQRDGASTSASSSSSPSVSSPSSQAPSPASSPVAAPGGAARPGAVAAPLGLALLPFADRSAGADRRWTRALLDAAFADELDGDPSLALAAPDDVAGQTRHAGALDPERRTPPVVTRIAAAFGADHAIDPSFVVVGEGASATVRVQLRVIDASGARPPELLTETIALADLAAGVRSVADRVRWVLGHAPDPAARRPSALPAGGEALRLHGQGLDALAQDDFDGARALLARASALEPDRVGPRAALAVAWIKAGDVARARAAAEAAIERARDWSPVRRGRLTFDLWYRLGDWPRATAAYEALATLGPTGVDAATRYGDVLLQAGRYGDARAFLAALRRGDPRAGRMPMVLFMDAQAAMAASDCEAALRGGAEAVARAREIGMRKVEADALVLESFCAQMIGETDRAYRAATGAYKLAQELATTVTERNALKVMGMVEVDRDPAAARVTLERRLSLAREAHDLSDVADTLALQAQMESWLDPTSAAKRLDEALAIYRKADERGAECYIHDLLSELAVRRGDLGAARRHSEAAVSGLATDAEPQVRYGNMVGLGRVQVMQGEIAAGRRRLADAVALGEQIHSDVSTGQLGLAEALLADGDPTAALALVRTIVPAGQPDDAMVGALEATVLSRLGRGAEALAVADRAARAFRELDTPRFALRARIQLAGVRLRHGDAATDDAARRALADLLAEAVARGDRLTALDARALAATGQRAQLTAVQREARSIGYGQLVATIRAELARR